MKRASLGEVVEVRTDRVVVRLRDYARGAVVSHADGLSSIGQPGDLNGIDGGRVLLVARIDGISMFDAGYAPGERSAPGSVRRLDAQVIGNLAKGDSGLGFSGDRTFLPPLGAPAVGLTPSELSVVLRPAGIEAADGRTITLGQAVSTSPVPVNVGIDALLTRHLAVLGSSGQGKTHFVAAVLQRLLEVGPNARIVIFDVHDEYGAAFRGLPGVKLKETVLGTKSGGDGREHYRISYYALGRTGLARLILPSDKTQRPALNFALDNLAFVDGDADGARLVGNTSNVLFDDCRPGGAADAALALQALKGSAKTGAQQWPHMAAVACLAAEWAALEQDQRAQGGWKRSAFTYGNVGWMIQRIRRLIDDRQFNRIVDTHPSSVPGGRIPLDMAAEAQGLVERIYGRADQTDWNVHIVTLKQLPSDLAPHVLGSLLELFAEQLFERGPGRTHPTLLVLEEAHHYLRQIPGDAETGMHSLAYERLAREGRKFQLALLISTQRPSEVSPTVLAQCGSWAVFRLTNEKDQAVISSGTEHASRYAVSQIPGLARGQAVLFGDAVPLAVKVAVIRPWEGHAPSSSDAPFAQKWAASANEGNLDPLLQ